MNCRDFTEFLRDWFADELPEVQRTEFEKHLKACPPCVHYLDSYRTTVELGRRCTGGESPVPQDVPEGLIQAILAARRKGD